MAVVSISFTAEGSKKIIGAINSMAVAIEDVGVYGADFDYEEDSTFFLQKSMLSAILFLTTEYRRLLEEKPF